ncbi:MAG: YdcF family protein [Lachnospiraceae bacterium]|nr:YdcF family protein [Lachnospiraceae bacterium]
MRNCLQTGCLALGILCFFYYIAIVIYAGFHTSMSWLWLLGSALFLFLWRAMIYQSRHPESWIRFLTGTLGILILLGVLVLLVVGSRIVGAMASAPQKELDYVVVLGAQVRGTAPSRALRRRLDRAVTYAEENPETVFVLSGGQGPDEGISEAECMYNYMTQKGIEPSRLLLEDKSTSTKENLVYSAELYGLKKASVGILSNNFHVYRAVQLAKKEGYQQTCGIPASADIGMQPHNILREICCVLVEAVRGNIRL